MDRADRYNFSDFTRSNYRNLLKMAKENYLARKFTDFNRDERFIIWRHDVDASVHSGRIMAQIEAEEDLTTTYFLHLHSVLYNVMEEEITSCIRDIQAMGHQLGLHFDPGYYGLKDETELENRLLWEKGLLERLFSQEIQAFSFHNPDFFTRSCRKWQYAGMINVYADYFQTQVDYCSDSNGYWKHRRLEDMLLKAEAQRLQVLIHPEWWQETVLSPKERIWRCIEGRAEKNKNTYNNLLKEYQQDNIDWE